MFCTKCGKQLPEDAQFCVGCGEKVSLPAPENVKSDEVQAVFSENSENQKFLLVKSKRLGWMAYKEVETQLEVTDDAILALQITKVWYKEKSRDTYMIPKREFQQIQVKTTWDKIDLVYAAFFAVVAYFTQWWILAGTAFCVWRAYGKCIEITRTNGSSLQIPSGSGSAIDEVVNYICSHWAGNSAEGK